MIRQTRQFIGQLDFPQGDTTLKGCYAQTVDAFRYDYFLNRRAETERLITDGLQVGQFQRRDTTMVIEGRATYTGDCIWQRQCRQSCTKKGLGADSCNGIGLIVVCHDVRYRDGSRIRTRVAWPYRYGVVRISYGGSKRFVIQQIIHAAYRYSISVSSYGQH